MTNQNVVNRDLIIDFLTRELIGPAPAGEPIDFDKPVQFTREDESYGPWRQLESGEEVLRELTPGRRYGMGVLYPVKITQEESEVYGPAGPSETEISDEVFQDDAEGATFALEEGSDGGTDGEEEESIPKSDSYFPSTMGISCLLDFRSGDRVYVKVSGGMYRETTVLVGKNERKWWLRVPIETEFVFDAGQLRGQESAHLKLQKTIHGIDLELMVLSRTIGGGDDNHLLTVTLSNRTDPSKSPRDSHCLFQSSFDLFLESENGAIKPYPRSRNASTDLEERSLELIYRNYPTYALGHNCSPVWDTDLAEGELRKVTACAMPYYESPSITSVIEENGTEVKVSMLNLADLGSGESEFANLKTLVRIYTEWIKGVQGQIDNDLPKHLHETAKENLNRCKECLQKIKGGIQYLEDHPLALEAFQLANHAMLLQQIASTFKTREYGWDTLLQGISFEEPFKRPDHQDIPNQRGYWRPFQIAFMLMAIESTANSRSDHRESVDLIWFPTGGGKTEAYLGLAAFSIFLRRLRNPCDVGTDVITRYTLRLLTSQQFQRTASLVCAMEFIRTGRSDLGSEPIRIGIWVGGNLTPNQNTEARAALRNMKKGNALNPFLLLECPWCKAEMGPKRPSDWPGGRKPTAAESVYGYIASQNTVILRCPDSSCDFASGLPVTVIDEELYKVPPEFLIATVDKFTRLTWDESCRSLFGIADDGTRKYSPPNLIIQDELHLISGPLGSMVGLFELLVEDLCSSGVGGIVPKIISSTATIRRYNQQVENLYAREKTSLFPPPGIDISDSFFSSYAMNKETNTLLPGRKYVGILAPSLGSMQTLQVRTYSALLESIVDLPPEQQDPWYTLMAFFGSLRELGTTMTLLQSDIRSYQAGMYRRGAIKTPFGEDKPRQRNIFNLVQLTSALKSNEIPQKIRELGETVGSDNPTTDVCLSSSIIEVGIDIDRLSLMSVTGQPKTTSQYIQVTGRVGRNWADRPGLIVTLYGASRPRDRSHYESFQSYHSRLYAQVEPTSVTPFAAPVLDRALHALMVGYVRQRSELKSVRNPSPFPSTLIEQFKKKVLERVSIVDPAESKNCEEVFERREKQWSEWGKIKWGSAGFYQGPDALLYPSGAFVPAGEKDLAWTTPLALRNVDAQCELEITQQYLFSAE